jgi:hypothetical protein
VSYTGPLPCTADDHVVGAAVLFVFNVQSLPPPDGLGKTPASVTIVGGDELFAGVRGQLTFNRDKKRWCPEPDAPPITVSGTWIAAPIDAGVYQVRGFYDRDGNFDPSFTISNLPTKGDVAGGAIENAADALAGERPIYRQIALGAKKADGTREIPEIGARVGGISVNLGLSLPIDRPVFYPKEVLDNSATANRDPARVTMPSDFQLETFDPFNPAQTESSFIRLKLGAGVAPDEADIAAQEPFNLPPKSPPPFFFVSWQDVNGDNDLDIGADHILDSPQIPSLFPLSFFIKLRDTESPSPEGEPTIVIQGLTLYKSLAETALSDPTLRDSQLELLVALRPSAICLPADPTKDGALVVSHRTDTSSNSVIGNESALKAALTAQFKRPIEIAYGCLPEGHYAMNLIYETGQAWTVPNEAGVCSARETTKDDGKSCISLGTYADSPPSRPLLASQSAVLTVGPPTDPSYCKPLPPACTPAKAPER